MITERHEADGFPERPMFDPVTVTITVTVGGSTAEIRYTATGGDLHLLVERSPVRLSGEDARADLGEPTWTAIEEAIAAALGAE